MRPKVWRFGKRTEEVCERIKEIHAKEQEYIFTSKFSSDGLSTAEQNELIELMEENTMFNYPKEKTEWRTYEEVAAYLLGQVADSFGLERVEGKQTVQGETTYYEIDAKGIIKGSDLIVLIESKHYKTTKRINKDTMASLAFKIIDTGAKGGITVSPMPLQKGAKIIATKKQITHVILNAEATSVDFKMQFLDKCMHGKSLDGSIPLSGKLGIEFIP